MVNMDKRVSVIVPVYNAETYLPQCIESILKQDYDNLELLLIDDGSSDKSMQICEEYGRRSGKIKVVAQKNSGVSAARNKGMENAAGEYILFVDADDYLPDSCVISRMAAAIGGADILVGDYMRLWNDRLLPAGSCSSFSGFSPEQGAFRFRGFFSVGTLSYVWCKMYRRSFLQENQLRFGEEKAGDKGYQDLTACTIFFAAFFDGKMNYEYGGKTLSAVKRVLKEYASYPLAKKYFSELARGRLLKHISPPFSGD